MIDEAAIDQRSEVASADLDGDGDSDLVIAGQRGNLAWIENVRGTLSEPQIIGVGQPPLSVTDVDGDGDPDIVSAYNLRTVAWYENLGQGKRFGSPNVIVESSRNWPVNLASGDLDGDGDNDLVISGYDNVEWHENTDGAGAFAVGGVVTDQYARGVVVVADVIGDADLEIVYAGFSLVSTNVVVVFSNSDGIDFALEQRIYRGQSVNDVDVVDLDGDDLLDVVVGSDRGAFWFRNTGDNGFALRATISSERTWSLDSADMDGDGDLDVVLATVDTDRVGWMRNTGLGEFGQAIRFSDELANQIHIVELNGDNAPDVVVRSTPSSRDEHRINWHAGQLQDGPQSLGRLVLASLTISARDLELIDLDGDGDLDAVMLSDGDRKDKVAWYENLGDGVFSEQRAISTRFDRVKALDVEDLDGDGDMDVVIGWYYNYYNRGSLVWFENLDGSASTWQHHTVEGELRRFESIEATDIDLDGDVDVIVPTQPGSGFYLYENIDNTGFTQREVGGNGFREAFSIVPADLDGDGDVDVLASGGTFRAGVAWLEHLDGELKFGEFVFVDDLVSYASSIVDDVDDDGDLDVIVASRFEISWFENDGQGQFVASHQIASLTSAISQISTADFDRDGDQDLIIARSTTTAASDEPTDTVFWVEKTGAGSYREARALISSNNVADIRGLITADVDGDGDTDAATVSYRDGRLVWFENRPIGDANDDGQFTSSDLVAVFAAGEFEDDIDQNSSFDEGDWNGDGEFDSSDLVVGFQAGTYVDAVAVVSRATSPIRSHSAISAATDVAFDLEDHSKRAFWA